MKQAFIPIAKNSPLSKARNGGEPALIVPQYDKAVYRLGYVPLSAITNVQQMFSGVTESNRHEKEWAFIHITGAKEPVDVGMSFGSVMRLMALARAHQCLIDFRDVEGLTFHKYAVRDMKALLDEPRYGTAALMSAASPRPTPPILP